MAKILGLIQNSVMYFNASKRYFFKFCDPKSKTNKSKMKDKIPKNLGDQSEDREKKFREAKFPPIAEKVDILDDIPRYLLATRTARIFQWPKNAMQSGTHNTKHWVIEFDTRERWENPNIGWCSSGDPISNMCLIFATKEEAIAYCERSGWKWILTERSLKPKYHRKRSYAQNFSNKRCRLSTK